MTTMQATNARRAHRTLRQPRSFVGAILDGATPAESDLVQAILGGLPINELAPLLRLGFTDDELANSMDMSRRTLVRRREGKGRLSVGEGDRLVRFAGVVAQAVHESFDTPDKAVRWMREPNTALDGTLPLDAIRTECGVALTRRVLGTIAYGGVL